jgi:CheY-like chemotaxis protein
MSKRVLTVGNCSSDHAMIARAILMHFEAEVVRASGRRDALDSLHAGHFDLVLVNRKLTGDGSAGVELIRQIKSDPQLADMPVMLLSDYPDYQATAVAEGAEPGFGKSQLGEALVAERLGRFLV